MAAKSTVTRAKLFYNSGGKSVSRQKQGGLGEVRQFQVLQDGSVLTLTLSERRDV
jgi:hypothetical protein